MQSYRNKTQHPNIIIQEVKAYASICLPLVSSVSLSSYPSELVSSLRLRVGSSFWLEMIY